MIGAAKRIAVAPHGCTTAGGSACATAVAGTHGRTALERCGHRDVAMPVVHKVLIRFVSQEPRAVRGRLCLHAAAHRLLAHDAARVGRAAKDDEPDAARPTAESVTQRLDIRLSGGIAREHDRLHAAQLHGDEVAEVIDRV